jgi:hypothetical protein
MRARIASIYFARVQATRLYGGPYEIPAVPIGADPVFLTLDDCVQIEQGPYQLGSNGKRSRRKHLVLGQVIARCLVAEWTANGILMTPDCHPGIWAVREQVPLMNDNGTPQLDADGVAQWRPATEEEKRAMWEEDLIAARRADRAYAESLFMHANAMAEDARLIPFIPRTTRLAAKQYGFEAEWLKEGAALRVKPCPYCTKVIPATAIKCPKCAEVVDVPAYARLEAEKKAYLNDINNKKQLKIAIEKDMQIEEKLRQQREALSGDQQSEEIRNDEEPVLSVVG